MNGIAGLKTIYDGYEQGSHRVGFRYPLGAALDEADNVFTELVAYFRETGYSLDRQLAEEK